MKIHIHEPGQTDAVLCGSRKRRNGYSGRTFPLTGISSASAVRSAPGIICVRCAKVLKGRTGEVVGERRGS